MPIATYPNYPGAEELQSFLESNNVEGLEACLDLAMYVDEAAKAFEEETRYRPFLAGSSTAYYYDPPGPNARNYNKGGSRLLFLDRGFVSISEVKVGITPQDSTGTVLELHTDFELHPYNYVADNVPITRIEFLHFQSGLARSIKITGVPGYASELPADAYSAILKRAAASVAFSLREGVGSGVIDWKEDDVAEKVSVDLIAKMGNTWANESARVMRRYTRMF